MLQRYSDTTCLFRAPDLSQTQPKNLEYFFVLEKLFTICFRYVAVEIHDFLKNL